MIKVKITSDGIRGHHGPPDVTDGLKRTQLYLWSIPAKDNLRVTTQKH